MHIKTLRLLIILFLFPAFNVSSQDFLGISTSNYAGVTGVMLQPASIVDSRHKFDINLFSAGTNFSNNYLQVNRKALLKFNSNNFNDYQTFKSKYLSEAGLDTSLKAWFDVNSRIQMPLSFMATVGKKSAIALNIQSRSMVQGRNISHDLASMAFNEFYHPPLNNQPINASGFSLNALSWIDIGLTYGRVLYSSDKHFLKGAFTAKYLGGVASLNMASNDLTFSVNNDSSVNFSTSRFNYNRNEKADFDIFDRNLKPDANAFGFNAGLVYEFRGNIGALNKISRDDQKSYETERRDVNKYLFRLGVSLLDAGVFNFNKASTVNNVSGASTNWNLHNANYGSIEEFDTALANRTTPFANDPRSYKIHLPTALSVQFDFRFVKGLYLNAMAYRPLKLNNNDGGLRFDNYGYYAITPRWEGRHFGIYIPYTVTNHKNITNFNQNLLGATFRMGPLFIGSSNLGTMAFKKNLKAADFHAGIKVGITYGKPNKASRLIEKLTKKEEMPDSLKYKDTTAKIAKPAPAKAVKKDTVADKALPLLIDYSNGKVYSDPNKPGNIIIINNNNYYYYNAPGKDSIVIERIILNNQRDSSLLKEINNKANIMSASKATMDTIITKKVIVTNEKDSAAKFDSASIKNNKVVPPVPAAAVRADSVQRAMQDSLNRKKVQLDSMIRKLEKLRKEMDTSSTGNIPLIGSQESSSISSKSKINGDSSKSINLKKVDTIPSAIATEQAATIKPETKKLSKDTTLISKKEIAIDSLSSEPAIVSDTIRTAKAVMQPISVPVKEIKETVPPDFARTTGKDIKKKSSASTDTLKVLIDQPEVAKRKKEQVSSNAVQIQELEESNAARQEALIKQQEEYYNKQIESAKELQEQISVLQANMRDLETYNNNLVPLTVPSATYNVSSIIDTVYLKDTIYLKDTLIVRDTLINNVIKKDTIRKPVPVPQKTVLVPIERETVVKEKFDYTQLPPEVILFEVNSANIRPVYFSRLNYLSVLLLSDPTLSGIITGHTDKTGSAKINKILSEKRANAVREYMAEKGVPVNQLIIEALSSKEPVAEGNNRSAYSQNRRVTIQLSQMK